jgi:hypothetical protein
MRVFVFALFLIGCVDASTDVTARELAAEEDVPHPAAPPPPDHQPDYPPRPVPVGKCLECHRPGYPGPLPPIPATPCVGCHNIAPPNDPHWPNYPPGPGRDLEPGPFPIPGYCLDCHKIRPKPIPVVVDAAQLAN